MRNLKRAVSAAIVAAVFVVAMAGMAMGKEKIEVKNNESRDFNRAIKTQTIMVLPADIEKKMLAQANEQFKFKVDRVFFAIEDPAFKEWRIFKSKEFPYDVTSRSRMAYLITKQDGKYIRTFWTVIQDVDPVNKKKWGDKYRFQAPMVKVPPAAYVDNFAPDKLTNKYVEGETP